MSMSMSHHDCISPGFSVLSRVGALDRAGVLSYHSVHPPQSGPSSRKPGNSLLLEVSQYFKKKKKSLPSHIPIFDFLCNIILVSSTWPYHDPE